MTRQMADDEVLRVLDHYAANVFLPNAGCDGVDLAEARAAVAALQAERDELERAIVALSDNSLLNLDRAKRAESALEALRGQVAGLVKLASRHEGHDPQLRAALLAIKERMG